MRSGCVRRFAPSSPEGPVIEQSAARSHRGWTEDPDEAGLSPARERMRRGVVAPSSDELRSARGRIDAFLRAPHVRFLVPLFEPEDPADRVPLDTLDYLLDDLGVGPEQVVVLDQGSADGPRRRAQERGVRRVDTLAAAGAIPEDLLLRYGLPRLTRGKGLNLFFGALLLASDPTPPSHVVLVDADLQQPARWDPIRSLAWPLLSGSADVSVGTHVGRNNEAVFAVRVACEALLHSPGISDAARSRLAALVPALLAQVHMLAGERILRFEQLLATPLSTGYGAETCITLAAIERGAGGIVQVVDGGERRDLPNGPDPVSLVQNEQAMMNGVARLLMFLLMRPLPLVAWEAADVRAANAALDALPPGVPVLPTESGPVALAPAPAERMLPAVRTLDAGVRRAFAAGMIG